MTNVLLSIRTVHCVIYLGLVITDSLVDSNGLTLVQYV